MDSRKPDFSRLMNSTLTDADRRTVTLLQGGNSLTMQDVLFAFVRLSTSDATKYNLFSWVAKTELSFSDESDN